MMRIRVALLFATVATLIGRTAFSAGVPLEDHLKKLFPSSITFSGKGGDPPHWKALLLEPGGQAEKPAGLAFLTTELEPLERGYDGPIKILVGMDMNAVLTSIVVVEHAEPYGHWSVMTPEFAAQFKGKSIRDPFKVGGDIDAVSRATITVNSAVRAVRNGARRVARRVLTP